MKANSFFPTFGLMAILAALTGFPSLHAGNLIVNGSFESGNYAQSLPPDSTLISAWTVDSPPSTGVSWIASGYGIAPQNGDKFVILYGAPPSGIHQTVATKPGTCYLVTFYLGVQPNSTTGRGPFAVKLTAGDQSGIFNHDIVPYSTATASWQKFSFVFRASATSTLIRLSGVFPQTGAQIMIDNVSMAVTTALPPVPTNLLVNGSFEDTENFAYTNGWGGMEIYPGVEYPHPNGWVVNTRSIGWIQAGGFSNANLTGSDLIGQDGHFYLNLVSKPLGVPMGGVTQTVPTVRGQSYVLSFYMGGNEGAGVTVVEGNRKKNFVNVSGKWQRFSDTFTAAASSTAISINGIYDLATQFIGLDNVVLQIAQAIPPFTLTTATVGDEVDLPPSTNAGQPITYAVASGPATISGHTVTFTGPGSVVLTASQAGQGVYAPAPQVTSGAIQVSPASP